MAEMTAAAEASSTGLEAADCSRQEVRWAMEAQEAAVKGFREAGCSRQEEPVASGAA